MNPFSQIRFAPAIALTGCWLILMACTVSAQTTVKGTVSDTLSKPIPHVQVLLTDSEDSILSFSQSDSAGVYRLIISRPGTYYLAFNALSYESKRISLEIEEGETRDVIRMDVTLFSEPIVFDEVIVQAERPIRVRGDTISYTVSDFARGDEEVVEDLLKNLPGLDVEDDGTIRFDGKEVEKVMVEGTDLFEKGYSLITKNLNAGFIDQVDVLQRYTDTPELRGLEESDKVALNLSLKDDARTSLFGNTTLGYNTSNNHEARVTLMSLGKSWKHYSFLHSNSMGRDPLGDISRFMNSSASEQVENGVVNQEIRPQLYPKGSRPALSTRRTRFNDSSMASYNVIFTPSDPLEIKWVSFGMFEKDRYSRESVQSFQVGSSQFDRLDEYSLTDRALNGFGRMEISFVPDTVSRLVYDGRVLQNRGEAGSDLLLNLRQSTEVFDHLHRETAHQVRYTNRTSDRSAWILSGSYSLHRLTEEVRADPFLPMDLFSGNDPEEDVSQESRFQNQTVHAQAKTIYRLARRFTMEARMGVTINNMEAESGLNLNGTDDENVENGELFRNNHVLDHTNPYLGISGRFSRNGLTLFSSITTHYLQSRIRRVLNGEPENSQRWVLEPGAGFEWELNNKNSVRASYSRNSNSASLFDMMEGYLFAGDRTFLSGLGSFDLFEGDSFFLNYTYGSLLNPTLFRTVVIYNRQQNSTIGSALVTPEIQMYGRRLGDNRQFLLVNFTGDILLRSLKNNLKLQVTSTITDTQSEINQNTYSYLSGYHQFGFEFRSVFMGKFNYNAGSSWTLRQVETDRRVRNVDQFQFVDLYADLSNRFKFRLYAERYHFGELTGDDTWYFLDGTLDYDLRPNKWKITFEARNLLNNHRFIRQTITDMWTRTTHYRIVSRYFLLKVRYRI